MNAEGKMKLAAQRLLGRYPLHGSILAEWQPIADPSVGTMGVSVEGAHVRLRYAPRFVDAIELDEVIGVLLHEVNHVLGEHLWMTPDAYPDRAALNAALEVTANEYIREPLPGNPFLLKDYPGLPHDEDAHERYKRLESKVEKEEEPLDDHALWEAIQRNPDLAQAIIGATVAVAVQSLTPEQREASSSAAIQQAEGIAGSAAKAAIRAGAAKSKVDWKKALRRYVGTRLSRRPSFSRSPRRFPNLLGIVPGHSWQGAKPRVMAVIDTSASIDDAMLKEISGELSAMAKRFEVVVVECDAVIRNVYPFKPIQSVSGRGGTDLRPPLNRDFLRLHKADLVVYFTDGYGAAPEKQPHVPVVWCLTPNGQVPAPWGRVIPLPEAPQARFESKTAPAKRHILVQNRRYSVRKPCFSGPEAGRIAAGEPEL